MEVCSEAEFSSGDFRLGSDREHPQPAASVFSPLEPTRNPGTRSFATNNNGSILYSLENLFTQAGQNLGYIRFRTRVNGTQP